MISAHLKDDAFLADVDSQGNDGDGFGVWWLGQSGFLVKYAGKRFLFDPYLSDSLTEKYANTDKPHVRMSERVVAPEKLAEILFATSSHNHTDHLDPETLGRLLRVNPGMQLVLPESNIQFAWNRLGEHTPALLGMNDGQTLQLSGFAITALPAAHNAIERDEHGRCRFLGYLIRFGPWTIYHSGDTLWHDGLVQTLLAYRPQLLLLPINGNKPERRVAGNLNGAEAAALAKACGAQCVIPCHYNMFVFNTETPELFESTCRHLGQPYQVLEHGQRFSSHAFGLTP